MNKPKISIIAAMSSNRVIGTENKLPWNIPDELKRFREITSGHPIIMGRKTHVSIGKVLPNRTNIIITRDPEYKVEGAVVVHSLEEALDEASKKTLFHDREVFVSKGSEKKEDEVFIIGGGEIYKQAIPLADKLYLTIIDKEYEGDTYFPDYSDFKKVIKEEKMETEDGISYTLLQLEK